MITDAVGCTEQPCRDQDVLARAGTALAGRAERRVPVPARSQVHAHHRRSVSGTWSTYSDAFPCSLLPSRIRSQPVGGARGNRDWFSRSSDLRETWSFRSCFDRAASGRRLDPSSRLRILPSTCELALIHLITTRNRSDPDDSRLEPTSVPPPGRPAHDQLVHEHLVRLGCSRIPRDPGASTRVDPARERRAQPRV